MGFLVPVVMLISFLILMITGCSNAPKNQGPKSEMARTAPVMDQNIITSVRFERGQKILSDESAREINKALYEAATVGQVAIVEVVVWSDMEYPANRKNGLPRPQVSLAQERARNLKAYIDVQAPTAEIKTYSMAEEPNSYQKLIDAQDAKMKAQLSSLGFTPSQDNNYDSGRTSTALVMIKVK